ncbi:M20/M25/M40 family metallo-hydrolase [Sinanaerobacter chloroacetimidivorans]|uniref:M20/M25/M40 family metallo-hydrolase n=1 Tax=Sinanaerobacter chloroacetimidivorans TaxID=2818044 RepID=A0A8J7W1X8_9FIRM|nr:M20/M25/M40 family metallo-hydrolase [Sinanaerobacter chloroacetimidivorans]MBR0599369.1 M20/M25/M40 family metallo-hydrolase [Sinanaerobacter chloroacetimidivorans]
MFRKTKLLSLILILMLVITSAFTSAVFAKGTEAKIHKPGEVAFQHLQVLSDEIGQRVVGTKGESDAREYICSQFQRIGYDTVIQDFTFTRKGKEYSSSNVIAVKPGKSSEVVIVGGHYDSVAVGRGADDNASGIAVILEVAEALKKIKTPYTIKFVAFGAEEMGLQGSNYYVYEMSEEEIKNTVAMINLDSLAAGDKMYVYGDEGEDGWVRDQALNIAKKSKLNLETNPGLNPDYPEGTTGLWSDHAPFAGKGIPYGYFEATNWELGDLDGYTQTVLDGEIWHTEKDMISYIEKNYPGRIEERLSTFSQVLSDLLKFMNKSGIAKN